MRVDTLDMIDELKKAMSVHHRWSIDLYQQLLCNLEDQLGVMDINSHHNCSFGKWYDSAIIFFDDTNNSNYFKIGDTHKQLHQASMLLYSEIQKNKPISTHVFQNYSAIANQLNDLINQVELDLWKAICLNDELTGLRNRQGMMIELRDENERWLRYKMPCSIAIADVDYFKKINDLYGHPQGDIVLKAIANKLQEEMRIYDRLYRYGGEEFLLCFPNTNIEETCQILERIRNNIFEKIIKIENDISVRITLSFGLAMMSNVSIEETIVLADKALIAAKNKGRNCVIVSNK